MLTFSLRRTYHVRQRITQVQGTNDSSVVSKWSVCHMNFFQDDFLQYFISKKCRRSPLINRGYYVRAKAVEHVFSGFTSVYCGCKTQIVCLGAGFDSSYFRLKQKGLLQNSLYIEVDFPDLVKRKCALITGNEKLRNMLGSQVEVTPENNAVLKCSDFLLLGVDLTDLDLLTSCFKHHKIDPDIPTLFLSEVVMTYIPPQSADSVISWSSAYFSSAVFAAYEQVYPHDGFGRVMMNHFRKIGSPLRCIDTYPGISDQANRFLHLGWPVVCAVDMNHFYTCVIGEAERARIENIELFDEFEELHLKCMHYVLVTAFKGDCEQVYDTLWSDLGTNNTGSYFSTMDQQSGSNPADNIKAKCEESDVVQLVPVQTFKGEENQGKTSHTECSENQGHITDTGCSDKTVFSDTAKVCTEIKAYSEKTNTVCSKSDKNRTAEHRDARITGGATLKNTTGKTGCAKTFSSFTESDNTGWCKRYGHAVCKLGREYCLVTGGFGEKGNIHSRLKDLIVLNLRSNSVLNVTNVNEVISCVHCQAELNACKCIAPKLGKSNLERMFHSVELLGSGGASDDVNTHRCLVYGGRTSPKQTCDDLCLLNIRLSKAEAGDAVSCDISVISPTGDIPCSRWRHCARLIYIQGREYMFVYGGRTVDCPALSDCHILDTQTFTWHKVTLSGVAIPALQSHSCTVHNTDTSRSTVIISGGLFFNHSPSSAVYTLDIQSCDSPQQFVATVTELPVDIQARYSHCSCVIGDCLVLVGGVSVTYPTPGLTIIDLRTHRTKNLGIQSEDLVLLHNFCMLQKTAFELQTEPELQDSGESESQPETELQLYGGGGNCFSFGTHFNGAVYSITLPHTHFLFGE